MCVTIYFPKGAIVCGDPDPGAAVDFEESMSAVVGRKIVVTFQGSSS